MPDKPSLAIRRAYPHEMEAVAAMARALAAEEGETSRATAEACAQAAVTFWVATEGAEPLAFAMTYSGYDLASASAGTHLGDIYVLPAYRRRGVGRALLVAIAQEAGGWLSFTVLEGNKTAQGFYAALGAQPVPVRFMAFGPEGLARVASLPHNARGQGGA